MEDNNGHVVELSHLLGAEAGAINEQYDGSKVWMDTSFEAWLLTHDERGEPYRLTLSKREGELRPRVDWGQSTPHSAPSSGGTKDKG